MKVAIQGELGSFSEAAARQLMGPSITFVHCNSFDDLFDAVVAGRADRGVVPVHNAIAGPVVDNRARTGSAPFRVLGELLLPVRQCLVVRPGVTREAVARVASHPVALAQCARFLAGPPQCVPVPVADTAGGVRDLMRGTLAADAVVAAEAAAERYGAVVLIRGVEDDPQNFTLFHLIGRA